MVTTIYEDGGYLKSNPNWHAEDSPMKARWVNGILEKNGLAPKRIAEVGCGAGEILLELQKLKPDCEYFGYEVSPQAFELCSRKARDGVQFHFEDISKNEDVHFDVVMLIDIFEHVNDYMGFISGFKDRSQYKIFHIPLDLSAQGLIRGKQYMEIRESIGHLHYFFKDTALATLKDCGYEIVDWCYTKGTQELPNQSLKTKIANVPRKLLQSVNIDVSARWLGGYSLMVLAK